MSVYHSMRLKLCARLPAHCLSGLGTQASTFHPLITCDAHARHVSRFLGRPVLAEHYSRSHLRATLQRPCSNSAPRHLPRKLNPSTPPTPPAPPPTPPEKRSTLVQNLASIVDKYHQESVIYKIARFKSRIEDSEVRISRITEVLGELIAHLGVQEDRLHPLVRCQHILRIDTFASLREALTALHERTPRDATKLSALDIDAIRLEGKISEIQLSITKQILGDYYESMIPTAEWPRWEKVTLRSARGRMRIVHKMVTDSVLEFEWMQEDRVALRSRALVEEEEKRAEKYALMLEKQEAMAKEKEAKAKEEKEAKAKEEQEARAKGRKERKFVGRKERNNRAAKKRVNKKKKSGVGQEPQNS
ncbi:hypothetical protein BDV93DRAFT_27752 [Ceratobasidium sp. AG-I]|nr:hypothetical protein BDV93DRAFT_27752 [Ceratobasidium sp. AG-I]